MLTDDQIIKFQKLWKQRFGEDLSREQVLEHGMKLIRLLQVVFQDP